MLPYSRRREIFYNCIRGIALCFLYGKYSFSEFLDEMYKVSDALCLDHEEEK